MTRPATIIAIAAAVGLLAVIVGAALHASARPAHACSCPSPRPPLEAFANSESVFAGKVVAVSDFPPDGYASYDPRFVTFKVGTVWKGPSYEVMFVTTPLSEASCGFTFIEGQQYIVYAWKEVDVVLCSRTRLAAYAQEDLDALGKGSMPKAGSIAPVPESRPEDNGGGCELSLGYMPGRVDLTMVGMLAPLAWLMCRKRSRR